MLLPNIAVNMGIQEELPVVGMCNYITGKFFEAGRRFNGMYFQFLVSFDAMY